MVEVGATGSANILSNDTLGTPVASIDPELLNGDGAQDAWVGTQFVSVTGDGFPVVTVTVSSDGTVMFTGTADANVFIDVVLPITTTTEARRRPRRR